MKTMTDQELAKLSSEDLQAHGQALQAERKALREYGRRIAAAMDHRTMLENSLRIFAKMSDQALETMKIPAETMVAVRAYRKTMELTEQTVMPMGVPSGGAMGGV
jgi:hypothetical protein